MIVRAVLQSPAVTCSRTTTLAEAAKLMNVRDVGSLVVMDLTGAMAGMVTDRDLAVRGYGQDRSPSTCIQEVMTVGVHSIGADADTRDAATTMMQHGVRRLPVTEDGKLCGMVGLDDLLMHIEKEGETVRHLLEAQTRPGSAGWAGGWD